jgi:hypothetical protein
LDPTEVFSEVAQFLSRNGYEVIVQQVKEELDNGRLREERLKTLTEVKGPAAYSLDGHYRSGTTTAEFVRREDYTDNEALILLLEAARRGIVETRAMAADVYESVRSQGLIGVAFAGERPEEPSFSIDPPSESVQSLNSLAAELERLIAQVGRP